MKKILNVLVFALALQGLSTQNAAGQILPKDNGYAHYQPLIIVTADHLSLPGHLAVPIVGRSPFPAVLLLVGSGAGNRYEDVPAAATADGKATLLFQSVEEALLRKGIAVMTYDKRGVSPKDDSFLGNIVDYSIYSTASATNLASDAVAAFDKLQSLPQVDPQRLAVLGHSEGTVLALKIAEQRPGSIQGLLMLGLLNRTFLDISVYQGVINPMRLFYLMDSSQDGFVDESEFAPFLSDRKFRTHFKDWKSVLEEFDKSGRGKIAEQEWRYYFEEEHRKFEEAIWDDSKPWNPKGLPRSWFREYLREGSLFTRQLKLCGLINVFHGEIDIQTPFEDALRLRDACRKSSTSLRSFKSYPDVGHAFSPRVGLRKWNNTVGPMIPQVSIDIADQASMILMSSPRFFSTIPR